MEAFLQQQKEWAGSLAHRLDYSSLLEEHRLGNARDFYAAAQQWLRSVPVLQCVEEASERKKLAATYMDASYIECPCIAVARFCAWKDIKRRFERLLQLHVDSGRKKPQVKKRGRLALDNFRDVSALLGGTMEDPLIPQAFPCCLSFLADLLYLGLGLNTCFEVIYSVHIWCKRAISHLNCLMPPHIFPNGCYSEVEHCRGPNTCILRYGNFTYEWKHQQQPIPIPNKDDASDTLCDNHPNLNCCSSGKDAAQVLVLGCRADTLTPVGHHGIAGRAMPWDVEVFAHPLFVGTSTSTSTSASDRLPLSFGSAIGDAVEVMKAVPSTLGCAFGRGMRQFLQVPPLQGRKLRVRLNPPFVLEVCLATFALYQHLAHTTTHSLCCVLPAWPHTALHQALNEWEIEWCTPRPSVNSLKRRRGRDEGEGSDGVDNHDGAGIGEACPHRMWRWNTAIFHNGRMQECFRVPSIVVCWSHGTLAEYELLQSDMRASTGK
jgi:hypothetical protein